MKTKREIRKQIQRFQDDLNAYYKTFDFKNVYIVEREIKALKWVLGEDE